MGESCANYNIQCWYKEERKKKERNIETNPPTAEIEPFVAVLLLSNINEMRPR